MKTKMEIKKIALSFTLSTVFTFALGICNAHAQATGSHGGDARCQEFFSLASEISIDLVKVGQSEINKVNPMINISTIRSQIMKPLVVLPAHQLPRQALSNPGSDETQLDVEAWDGLTHNEKVKLVTHELMVLSMAESDGEYIVSQDALQVLNAKGFLVISQPTQTKIFSKKKQFHFTYGRGGHGPDCDEKDMQIELVSVCTNAGFTECRVTQSEKKVTREFGKAENERWIWNRSEGAAGYCEVLVRGTK